MNKNAFKAVIAELHEQETRPVSPAEPTERGAELARESLVPGTANMVKARKLLAEEKISLQEFDEMTDCTR